MSTSTTPLTERWQEVLDFEGGAHWVYAGAKEEEIRRRFDCGATRYYQVLNSLLDKPEALAYAPQTVKRLRRLRSARAAFRGRRVPHAAARG